jgi:hypothetical protein
VSRREKKKQTAIGAALALEVWTLCGLRFTREISHRIPLALDESVEGIGSDYQPLLLLAALQNIAGDRSIDLTQEESVKGGAEWTEDRGTYFRINESRDRAVGGLNS